MDDISMDWGNARSFTEKDRPDGMILIGKETKSYKTGRINFLYYQDAKGNLWYESKRTEEDKKLPA